MYSALLLSQNKIFEELKELSGKKLGCSCTHNYYCAIDTIIELYEKIVPNLRYTLPKEDEEDEDEDEDEISIDDGDDGDDEAENEKDEETGEGVNEIERLKDLVGEIETLLPSPHPHPPPLFDSPPPLPSPPPPPPSPTLLDT